MKKILLAVSILSALFMFGCQKEGIDNDAEGKEFALEVHVGEDPKDGDISASYSKDIHTLDIEKLGISKDNLKKILDNNDHGKSYLTLKKGSDGLFTPVNLTLEEPSDLNSDEVAIPSVISELASSSYEIINKLEISTHKGPIELNEEDLKSVNYIATFIRDLPHPKYTKDDIGKMFKITYVKDGDKIKVKSKDLLENKSSEKSN